MCWEIRIHGRVTLQKSSHILCNVKDKRLPYRECSKELKRLIGLHIEKRTLFLIQPVEGKNSLMWWYAKKEVSEERKIESRRNKIFQIDKIVAGLLDMDENWGSRCRVHPREQYHKNKKSIPSRFLKWQLLSSLCKFQIVFKIPKEFLIDKENIPTFLKI